MAEDVTPRQLLKQVDGTDASIEVDGSGFLTAVTATNGWETIVQGIVSGAAVHRTYIDLQGYTMEDLTFFTQGVDIQKMRTPLGSPANNFPLVWEYDILSTRALNLEEMAFFPTVPGFLPGPSTLDQQMIVYGQSRTYAENAQIPGTYVTTDTATFGSGNPIATSKLHWTRLFVFSTGGVPGQLSIYPSNLLIQGTTAREKDLIWVERLRRSNVLQGLDDT
jgi:hypothetical protein